MSRLATTLASLTVGALVSVTTTVWSAPAAVADPGVGDQCTDSNETTSPAEKAPEDPSQPLVDLQIADAQKYVSRLTGQPAGTGVTVAVIDSGVTPFANIPVVGTPFQASNAYSAVATPTFYHGTAMAGIIAGKSLDKPIGAVGVAPGATIYDARVYDQDPASDDLRGVSQGGVVEGLLDVAEQVRSGQQDIRVANVSLSLEEDTPELRAAVRAVTAEGVIVVASSGNRDEPRDADEEEPEETGPPTQEDVAATRFPAGYAKGDEDPLVVAAGTTVGPGYDGSATPGLLSSAIDVVVPTFGAVSYGNNGRPCVFGLPSTSVAAATVSGILALLISAFPQDTPRQVIARLEATATGAGYPETGKVDRYAGRGVVQPLDALRRALTITPDGVVDGGPVVPPAVPAAALPVEEPDVLRGTRRNAVWWGLFGGGALVVALLLRPVLVRRRR